MAVVLADRILTRLRELLQDGMGSIRTIASSRFDGDLPPGLDPTEERRRAVLDSKPLEIELSPQEDHPNRLTVAGNVQIWYVPALIRVVRTIALEAQVSDTLRDDVRAQAVIDAGMIADALEWPPNLATTNAGNATGMIGAKYLGGSVNARGVAGEAMDITEIFRVRLTVVTNPATS